MGKVVDKFGLNRGELSCSANIAEGSSGSQHGERVWPEVLTSQPFLCWSSGTEVLPLWGKSKCLVISAPLECYLGAYSYLASLVSCSSPSPPSKLLVSVT